MKYLNTRVFLTQPDLYVLDKLYRPFGRDKPFIFNRKDLINTIRDITRISSRIIHEMVFGIKSKYPADNNITISTLLFNNLTAEKLSYTKYLTNEGLTIPGTKIMYGDLDKNIRNVIVKFPYSSNSKCTIPIVEENIYSNNSDSDSDSNSDVSDSDDNESKNDFSASHIFTSPHYCLGRHLGYIQQPLIKDFIEIRCFVVDGIAVCYVVAYYDITQYFLFEEIEHVHFNSLKEKLLKINQNKLDKLCSKVFNGINHKFKLQERYMRIDIFFTENGKLYVNEIEPFASGKIFSGYLHYTPSLQIKHRSEMENILIQTIIDDGKDKKKIFLRNIDPKTRSEKPYKLLDTRYINKKVRTNIRKMVKQGKL